MIPYRIASAALAVIALGTASTATACLKGIGRGPPMILVLEPTFEASKERTDVPIATLTGVLVTVAGEFAEDVFAADSVDSYATKRGCEPKNARPCLAERAQGKAWYVLETSIIASGSTFEVKQSLLKLDTMTPARSTTRVAVEAAALAGDLKDSTRSILRGDLKALERRPRPCS